MSLELKDKVLVRGYEYWGFGEVDTYPDKEECVRVVLYNGPEQSESIEIPVNMLDRKTLLPAQTRCYIREGKIIRTGRIISCVNASASPRKYNIKLPNYRYLKQVCEDEFTVRSYLSPADPVETLAIHGHETPFFYQVRSPWFSKYTDQLRLTGGLTGLISSRVKLFPHQVEVVRRVLQDPIMRYLLADEVGLGKTIETGMILRQVRIDYPDAQIVVFVPDLLRTQWKAELAVRFDLADVAVFNYNEIPKFISKDLDLVAIDEAHHVVATTNCPRDKKLLFQNACQLSRATKHLLLLSATPVLHHEEEMLGLLHLLDPEAYQMKDLALFRQRLELRKDVGRELMALESARNPVVVKRNVQRLAGILAKDKDIQALAQDVEKGFATDDVEKGYRSARALHIHVSETYRVYRRMLRTRRKMLRETGIITPKRKLKALEFELDEERAEQLWGYLEEWRIRTANHADSLSKDEKLSFIDFYLEMAYAITVSSTLLHNLVTLRLASPDVQPFETHYLESLREVTRSPIQSNDRIIMLDMLLKNLSRRERRHTKHVVFCGRADTSAAITRRLKEINPLYGYLIVHNDMSRTTIEKNMDRFRLDRRNRFLIADKTIEEGQNLQYSEGFIMYDLPWDPMRIEQRIGRLDRIDRDKDISCRIILSHEDETLALDTAWFEILEKGLGLFNYSISDLQFLAEKEVTRLKQRAFEGGPAALADESSQIAETVRKEREISDEQDIIDGLHLGEILDSSLWKNFQKTEEDVEGFRHRLTGYLYGSLGIQTRIDNGILNFRRGPQDPLVPTDLLIPLYGYVLPSTVSRSIATQKKDLQFLRLGNPFIEGIREILDWDERGRAYSMWRQTNGIHDPLIIFRINLISTLDIEKVEDTLSEMKLDQFSSQSILRLVSGWFPVSTFEHFVDAIGDKVDSELAAICREPYRRTDINLAGERSPILYEIAGQYEWPHMCRKAAQRAINSVMENTIFIQKMENAHKRAHEYFDIIRSRLIARRHRSIEQISAVDRALKQEKELLDIVVGVINEPLVAVDSIGAYILSEKPVWQDQNS